MVHPNPLSTGITNDRKRDILGTGHHITPSFKYIYINKLEYLIGKLNRAAHIINPDRYFLNQLHHLLKREKKWGQQILQSCNIQDLHLCINIIQWFTEKVVPINNIVFTNPKVTLWSYSFKYFIGVYNDKFMAWRWHIAPEWHGMITLNILDLLASEISIYMTI